MDEKHAPPPTYGASDAVALQSNYIKPQHRKPHDPSVSFEEYYYYAEKTRKEEDSFEAPKTNWKAVLGGKKESHNEVTSMPTEDQLADSGNKLEISDEEWTNASRMFRTAGWGACEYKKNYI